MKRLTIPSILSAMAFCASFAAAQTITPTRVGPVSQYGQLITGKNSQGKGQIYGSCEGVKDGSEVQVRGMSLYWSLMPQAMEFWTEEGITTMVNDMKIQIVRAAMATKSSDNWNGEWNGIKLKGWEGDQANQTKFVETVVEAAIKNDIYVIIDWHSHSAHQQTESAKTFFKTMAEKYGQYDNVIFEVFNEPENISWSDVKNYANQVIQVIRQYSDNLVLVGNPSWDQNPSDAIGNEVNDSKKNTAYTLHYYANTHNWSGSYEWGGESEGAKGEKAMNAGLSVFVSEWGTGNADGKGTPDQNRNKSWQDYVNKHKLSWANWSASYINEGTAAFQDGSNKNSLQYTQSGNLVKGYLDSNPTSYTKCAAGNNNENQQGQGQQGEQGQQEQSFVIVPEFSFSITLIGKTLNVTGPDAATVDIFNTQGTKLLSVDQVNGSLPLTSLPVGQYIVRVRSGSASLVRAIAIK
ncbi:glycoside hydrolase family 5 protein [uncultured Fibrobacter sp.]|uniref:glycoside hydrolase family 5 protein n=1 Tax=uncultured Fibrobacter sp. TaxID=261512 RepID=UPI0026083DF6|nr:glycoside hydrolase family 5 protein [uncultured Fibrobacter sp.]